MKITLVKKSIAVASLALAALALPSTSNAQVTFSYEDSVSGNAVGSAFTFGTYRINLQLFDAGTIYPSLGAPGSAAGFGANGSGTQTIAGGISTLNGLQVAGPTGGRNGEDTWGIGRVLTITDTAGSVIWSEANKNAEITLMFYGLQDFYINQLANGYQEIDGAGLRVDWYHQSKTNPLYTQYNPLLGTAGRTGVNSYATVTDGEQFLTTISTPGFIYGPGTLGGTATEFSSIFNVNAGGSGQTYLSVTGGTMASQFDSNSFISPYLNGMTADMFAQFTTVLNTDPTIADWLVRGNDPVQGNLISGTPFTPIPEPSTYGLIGAGALLALVALRRRAQKQARA